MLYGNLPYNRTLALMKANRPPTASRIELRVPADKKALIEHAAALEGRSLTDFSLTALVRCAQESIEQHAVRMLSTRDSERFVAMLGEPAEPNATLRGAFRALKANRKKAPSRA